MLLRCGAGGPWYAELDQEHWGESEDERAKIQATFDGAVGDRRQELVFIGQSLNKEKLVAALDSCLMTPEEDAVSVDRAFVQWPSRKIINGLTPVLFTTTTLTGCMDAQSLQHSGLLVKRSLKGKFDQFRVDIDAVVH